VPTSNHALLLNFDQCDVLSGGTWADSSGNGYSAKVNGGVTVATDGDSSHYHFDGTNGFMHIENLNFKNEYIMALEVEVEFRTNYTDSYWANNWAFLDFDRSEWFNTFVRADNCHAQMSSASPANGISDDLEGTTSLCDNQWHTVKYTFSTDGTASNLELFVDGVSEKTVTGKHLAGIGDLTAQRYGFIGDGSEASSQNGSRNNHYFTGDIRRITFNAQVGATTAPTNAPTNTPCQVTVYEHWPEGITTGIAGMEAAEQAWGGHFPTGASMVLDGTGNHPLGALSNLTSSVKTTGTCCKAYGYTSADCSGTRGTAIEATTQLLQGLPAGVVTPATGLSSTWGCNDCAQCVEVTQVC
jgi:hypothetical protein